MGNQFKSVAVIACLKTFLFVFNIVFWITGVLLLIVGLWAAFDLHRYMDLSPEFSDTAPHVIIGIACLIVIVSSVAFSCIIKGQPVLLYLYGGFLACIFVMDTGVGAAVACYRDTYPKSLHDGLVQTISSENYINFDFAQRNLHCCGVSNYTDWITLSPHKVIPLSCCQSPTNCVTANYGMLYQRGCFGVITEYLENNMSILIGVAMGTALLPAVGTVLSCLLASHIKRSKYDTVN